MVFAQTYPNKTIKCYTIGSPRVGNHTFEHAFRTHVKESYRIYNKNDPISKIPLSLYYTHVGCGICLDYQDVDFDAFTSHEQCIYRIDKDISFFSRLLNFFKTLKHIEEHDSKLYIKRLTSLKKYHNTKKQSIEIVNKDKLKKTKNINLSIINSEEITRLSSIIIDDDIKYFDSDDEKFINKILKEDTKLIKDLN